jgi:hypothetical protein
VCGKPGHYDQDDCSPLAICGSEALLHVSPMDLAPTVEGESFDGFVIQHDADPWFLR